MPRASGASSAPSRRLWLLDRPLSRAMTAKLVSRVQLLREGRNGLLVDGGLVPRRQHREVRRALAITAAGLPAEALEQVGDRGQRVGDAVDQVTTAVAVEID